MYEETTALTNLDSQGELADATAEHRSCLQGKRGYSQFQLDDAGAEGNRIRTTLVRQLLECIPDLERVDSFAEYFAGVISDSVAPGVELAADEAACVIRHVIDNAEDPARTLAVGDTSDGAAVFFDASERCMTAANYAVYTGATGSGPQSYGDHPDLDLLYDRCDEGNPVACDLLWLLSSEGSAYQALTLECGGAPLPTNSSYCTDDLTVDTETGDVDVFAQGLVRLEGECAQREMLSCDLLAILAPPGSNFQQLAFSCGGRATAISEPNCRTAFPDS